MEKVVATVEVEGETYHYCCPLQYLEYKGKHTMEVDGRFILLIYHQYAFYFSNSNSLEDEFFL